MEKLEKGLEKSSDNTEKIGLKREVGLASAVNFMLSFVIGTGIFVTPGTVLAQSGSVGMTLVIWALCGLISFLACLPFGELSSVVPKSGSIYIYLHTTFNKRFPTFGGLPAFIFFWMMYVIILPCSVALGALLFSEYTWVIMENIFDVGDGESLKFLLGASVLVIIGALNCFSVKIYVKSQDILCYVKMAAIVFFVGCGIYLLVSGKALKFDAGFEGTNYSVAAITRAIYFGLYTYDGGCFITNITEEMKRPEKNILRSILIGLTITTMTYVLLNVTFLTVLTPHEVASGHTVIAQFAIKFFGVAGGAISASIICLALLTSIMSGIFYASRIGYVAAREGHMMDFFCCIHKTRKTPAPAVVSQVLLALMFYFFVGGNANALIDTYAFFIWLSYGMAMTCLLILRKQLPDAPRPFRVPTVIPVLVALLSIHLFVTSMITGPFRIILIFVVCVLSSTIVYYIFICRKLRFTSLAKLQTRLQHVLGLVLPSEEPSF